MRNNEFGTRPSWNGRTRISIEKGSRNSANILASRICKEAISTREPYHVDFEKVYRPGSLSIGLAVSFYDVNCCWPLHTLHDSVSNLVWEGQASRADAAYASWWRAAETACPLQESRTHPSRMKAASQQSRIHYTFSLAPYNPAGVFILQLLFTLHQPPLSSPIQYIYIIPRKLCCRSSDRRLLPTNKVDENTTCSRPRRLFFCFWQSAARGQQMVACITQRMLLLLP